MMQQNENTGMAVPSAIATIKTDGKQIVTFYSIADLAETLKEAEEWHKKNHLPSGEWAKEYASHIFNTEASENESLPSQVIRAQGNEGLKIDSLASPCHMEETEEDLARCIEAFRAISNPE